jgi:hypothetical protein
MPGDDSTYTQAMAQAAAAAAPQPPVGALCLLSPKLGQCSGVASCDGGKTNDAYFLDDSDLGGTGYCYVWLFAPGLDNNGNTVPAGYVYASQTQCGCPYSTAMTWN